MIARDVVKAAALLAARHAFAELPASLVRWAGESRSQAEGDYPHCTLSSISHVPEGPMSIERTLNTDGLLDVSMSQVWIWTVQVKGEGWKLESPDGNNPVLFTHKMRSGWYLQSVTEALRDPDSDPAERTVVSMVDEAGQILTLNQNVRGHTLPVHVFEIEFRYVECHADPTAVDVLEVAVLDGTLEGVAATITNES